MSASEMLNRLLVKSAWLAAQGKIAIPSKPYQCLSLQRRIIEHAWYGGTWEFYPRYLKARTTMPRARNEDGTIDWTPYASDVEASMKLMNFIIHKDDRDAGDLLFNWEAAKPFGHVGMLLDKDTVIENIDPKNRPGSINLYYPNGKPMYISLTPFENFKTTNVARLQRR